MRRTKSKNSAKTRTNAHVKKNEFTFKDFAARYKLQERAPIILTTIAIALLGLHWLYTGHAATFAVSKEAENGTLAGNATVWNATNAGNGQAVRFGGQGNCTVSAILVNSCRPWFGAAASGNPGTPTEIANGAAPGSGDVAQFNYLANKLIGHQLDVWRGYDKCGNAGTAASCSTGLPFDSGSVQAQMANTSGMYADLNWKPADSWAQAGGSNAAVNGEIKQVADNIKALNKKVFLTIWHEPENDVSAWDTGADGTAEQNYCTGPNKPNSFGGLKGKAGTPDQYKAMWHNVENIFKQEGATNVVWVYDTEGYAPLECFIPELYPGANYTDWWIGDVYGFRTTFDATAGKIYSYMSTKPDDVDFSGLPWGIGEFNECNNTSLSGTETYFQNAKAAFDANSYPKFKMYIIYADTNGPNSGSGGCLTDYGPPSSPGAGDSPYWPGKQQAVNALALDILNK